MPPRNHVYDKGFEPVPGYRLTEYLGGGTFGEVWKAIDLSTSKHFALKIIDLSYSSSALKELRALKLVMNLNHPNLVPITKAWLKDKHGQSLDLHAVDLVRQKGKLKLLLILMGLGQKSLSARLKELNHAAGDEDDDALAHGIPPDELTNYMLGAAKGIDYLNAARHEGVDAASDGPIVHCDIKPDNMMIVAGTEVQIADCGVAVSLNQDTRKTVSAAFSPVYAPPELTTNRPSTGTDQYSLAISYYELRTGRRPFADGMNQLEMMTAHSLGDLDFSSPTLTEGERKVIKWATSPRIAERYPSCLDMVKQLERAIEGLKPKAPGDVTQKSVPVMLVAAPPSATVAPPAPRSPALGDTHEYHADRVTPPPAFAAPPEATTAFAPEPAAKAPGSRPVILIDRDDPTGGELPEPELDQELLDIIHGSQVVPRPGSRKPYEEPPARPNPPARPPAVVDLVETVIRPETEPEPVEPARPRRLAAPVSRYDGTVVPGGQLNAQRLGPKAANPARPSHKPAAAKKSPAPLIGAAVGLSLLAIGGFVAYTMSVATTPSVATDTKPTDTAPTQTKPTETETKPTGPGAVPTDRGPTPLTPQQVFAKRLDSLTRPFAGNKELVQLFEATASDTGSRKLVLDKLLGDGSDTPRLAELADFATASDKWADFGDRRAALANAWYEARLRPPYDEAVAGLLAAPTPEAAAGKLAGFREAMSLPTVAKLDALFPDKLQRVNQFDALANTWENAKAKLPEFAEAVSVADEPPAGKFFAAEYVRLARDAKEPLPLLKAFRDATKSWSGADAGYQTALAESVQASLLAERPEWAAIARTCGKDGANGWKALAAAEEQLRTAPDAAAKAPRLPDVADAAGKQFARYLTSYASQDPDGLVELYKDAKAVPPLLGVKSRKLIAAGIILKGTPLLKAHRSWAADPLAHLFTNPYDGEPDLVAKAGRLDTATRLSGQWGKAEQMHRYLISVALKSPDQSLTAGLKVGEGVVKDEHRAAALAYSMAVFKGGGHDDLGRVKAGAAAARLAFHQLDLSFANCVTDKETNDLEKAIAARIQGEILNPCLAILGGDGSPVAKSLRLSTIRAEIILKALKKSERLEALEKSAQEVAGTTDEAAALGLLALFRYIDAYPAADEAAKPGVWADIRRDATNALALDRESVYGSLIVNYLDSCEYKDDIVLDVKGPAGAKLVADPAIDRALEQFRVTAENLKTRKLSRFHSMRAKFLTARASELEEAGKDPDGVAKLRDQAKEAGKKATLQKGAAEAKAP